MPWGAILTYAAILTCAAIRTWAAILTNLRRQLQPAPPSSTCASPRAPAEAAALPLPREPD